MTTASLEVISALTGRRATISRTADGQTGRTPTLPPGLTPTSWTKTDANTGVASLTAGHGLVNGDVVAVLWSDAAGMPLARYGLTVTLEGDNATVDGGAGADLPASDTPVIVAKRVVVDLAEAGDDIVYIEASGRQPDGATAARVLIVFLATGNVAIAVFDVTDYAFWAKNIGVANPLAGATIAAVWMFNGAAATNNVNLQVVSDTTP